MCLKCNYKWDALPGNILSGHGCKMCNTNKLTEKDFLNKIHKHNPNIIINTSFTTTKVYYNCTCNICGHNWNAKGENLTNGQGCPNCAIQNRLITDEEYKKRLYDKYGENIICLDAYIGGKKKLKYHCNICGHNWSAQPCSVLHLMYGCPNCTNKINGKNHRITKEEFLTRVDKNSPTLNILTGYTISSDRLKVECKLCKYTWTPLASHVMNGLSCPNCCEKSKGELKIKHYLEKTGIVFKSQFKFEALKGINGGSLSYDFYLPEHNTLIEFQGEQHEKPIKYFGGEEHFKIQQEHDKRKRNYANLHNINLLEIWYYEDVEEKLDKYFNNLNNNLNLESVETVTVA